MVIKSSSDNNMCDDAKSDARLNVLYSPFRKREVNPQDWESKMLYWKTNIIKWCLESNNCVFTLAKLQSVFVRNGRPASCLTTVLDVMVRSNEVIPLQDLMSKDPSTQSWSTWAVNYFVKTPIVWSLTKLKESLVADTKDDLHMEYICLSVLKKQCDLLKEKSSKTIIGLEEVKSFLALKDDESVKVVLQWLQLQGKATVAKINNTTIVKLSPNNERVKPFSEADIGLCQLQQNEQTLVRMLEQLEKEKQAADQEARDYLKKNMRQVAKSCLRKKRELEKCIDKRASALENVQVLISRVREAESDGEILESYRMGLSALKATFKDAGLSEDAVSHTMDQVQEVLEVHEEIQSALSEPLAASVDEDLENELAELLSGNTQKTNVQIQNPHKIRVLPDLPEPPSHSPTSSSTRTSTRVANSLLQ